MSAPEPAPSGDAGGPEGTADRDGDLAFLLSRAGIALPPVRFAAVAAEYAEFRGQIELVNRSLGPSDEPAPVFDARPSPARR